mgnify:CR=1 FL=1
MRCRFCSNELTHKFIDLINSPASNSFLTKEQLIEAEVFYPLRLFVCDKCFLVQIDEYKKSDEILGIHMIGARCADLISEAVVAMEFKASAEDIARISHAHPTYSEAVKEAALSASENRPIHI